MEKRIENHKEEAPFLYYAARFRALDPEETASRCRVRFDGSAFFVRMLQTEYRISWPEFGLTSASGEGFALKNRTAQTFLLRFLTDGHAAPESGRYLTFRELPWGEVYVQPFTGRCLRRAAFSFGGRLDAFRAAAEALGAVPIPHGDAAYRFTLLDTYRMELILWAGDDEFPPSSQILFSENFAEGFTAEDRAVAGDLLIGAIGEIIKKEERKANPS